MRIFKQNIGRLLSVTLAFLSLTMLPSCINDYSDCQVKDKDGRFHMSFTIVTKNVPGSRAADIVGDQIGTIPENYLDVNDVRMLLFDKDQNFLSDFTPKASVVVRNADFTIYDVRAKLDDPYFVDKINENGTEPIEFYILVLANYSNWGISLPPLQTGLAMTDMFASATTMTILPDSEKLLNAVTDPENRQLFPMAGLQRFSINGINLLGTTESTPFNISNATDGKEVNLLRSLTKIEVIDKVNIGDNEVFTEDDKDNPLRIEKVELDGYMTRGTLIPEMGQWNRNATFETQQVIAPTVPNLAEYMLPPVLNINDPNNPFGPNNGFTGYNVNLVYDERATMLREDKCPVYSGYVFEYSQAALVGVDTTQQPYMRVTTKGSDSEEEPMESLLLPLRLADYSENPPVNVPFLLRNHIYRYEIVGIHQDIRINWTVCPMDNATINIGFN